MTETKNKLTILVVGATGSVGRHVVDELLERGVGVRALVRDPDTAGLPAGVVIVRGDLRDLDSVRTAATGADGAFLMWPFLDAEGATETVTTVAAQVRRIVYLSASGVDPDAAEHPSPIHAFHAALENAVERGATEWVMLRPSSFAGNALGWAEQMRAGLVEAPDATAVRAMIDEADIAAVAAEALVGDALTGTRPELTGPAALTTAEQVRTIADVVGLDVRFAEIPLDVARSRAVDAGFPAGLVTALFDPDAPPVRQEVTDTVERITGRPPRTLRQWARTHTADFTGVSAAAR